MRVLHAADFHLDSAFGALTAEQARQRRAESRESVQRLVDWANDHEVQLLLLAAVQRGEGHVALDQQLIAHKLAAAHLRIQPPQQQILRRRLAGRHRRLACDGALPLRHGARQAQLSLLPPQPQ